MPWVPPYFGSYDELVRALMHNPFLGSDPEPPHPHSQMMRLARPTVAEPQPSPWRHGPGPDPGWQVVAGFVAAVNVQVLASHVGDEATRKAMEHSARQTIAQLLDDYCGTPPRVWRWPLPWPPPWVFEIASELNAIASALPDGAMRSGLQAVAGQVIAKGVGAEAVPQRELGVTQDRGELQRAR